MREQIWTVARFPNGHWSTGGRTDDPSYSECEVFQVLANSRDEAKKKAQAKRSRMNRASQKGTNDDHK